jgi:signal transduction histidine kinase
MSDIERLENENKKLQKIIAVKSDLISITAHQLRTSLCALKWTLEMLIDKDFGDINEEQKDCLQKALASNERMISLVTTMLADNHTDGAALSPQTQEVDIEKLLAETITEFYGETHKRKITLSLAKPSSAIPSIHADAGMIRVILQGVIENAIKYSNEGGTVLISRDVHGDAGQIVISIHNDGISIAEADQPHIFDKFFRAPDVKEAKIPGSGLGLFIARTMLEQQKGAISFESKPETGTTFFITIPAA